MSTQLLQIETSMFSHEDTAHLPKNPNGAKNFRFPFIKKILMYETLSETEFIPPLSTSIFCPNTFVDISHFIEEKCEIFSIFTSEIMQDNLPRSTSSIKALAQYRGSRIGVEFAEAFMLLQEIL